MVTAMKLNLSYFMLILLFSLKLVKCSQVINSSFYATSLKDYVFWPNGVVPFYIETNHFDDEQKTKIMTALAMFTFNTCIKFVPTLVHPKNNEHVMVFHNPTAQRKCSVPAVGTSIDDQHLVVLGYDCLRTPKIEMVLMKNLGFTFEHNRASRDLFIDVQIENVEGSAIRLFTKESSLPNELRSLEYDVNSVMHFDERDYSKNGHRTIVFKRQLQRTNNNGLSPTDVRKIDIVYGPECHKRDRQEKKDLCQSYPGVARRKRHTSKNDDDDNQNKALNLRAIDMAEELQTLDEKYEPNCRQVVKEGMVKIVCDKKERRKREVTVDVTKSLRINPDITAPPNATESEDAIISLSNLGITSEVQSVVDQVFKVGALALQNARIKYCNESKALRTGDRKPVATKTKADIAGIVDVVAEYASQIVETALKNLTEFCESAKSIEAYQRVKCSGYDNSERCRQYYKSTKSGPVKYRTQHRPYIRQSTNHKGIPFVKHYFRSNNNTEATTETLKEAEAKTEAVNVRMKREAEDSEKNKSRAEELNPKAPEKEQKYILRQKLSDVEDEEEITFKDRPGQETLIHWSGDESKSTEKEDTNEASTDSAKTEEESGSDNKDQVKREKHEDGYVRGPEDEDLGISRYKSKNKEHEKNNNRHKIKVDSQSEPSKEVKNSDDDRSRRDSEDEERRSLETDIGEKEGSINKNRERSRLSAFIPEIVNLSKINEEFYSQRRWQEMEVPYVIVENEMYDTEDMRRRLREVNSILKSKTCVEIKEISDETAKGLQDFMVINVSPDYVTGKVGGRQIFGSVELFRGGQHRQHAAMMVMAMLGFYFEVSRHDRDDHIRVHMRHIRPDKLHHFEKIRDDGTLPLPYDYESATHPAWQFWRKVGKTGISTVATYKERDPDGSIMKSLGQHEELLSKIDLVKINSVYGIDCFNKQKKIKSDRNKKREI